MTEALPYVTLFLVILLGIWLNRVSNCDGAHCQQIIELQQALYEVDPVKYAHFGPAYQHPRCTCPEDS